jgi:hypothetical protein
VLLVVGKTKIPKETLKSIEGKPKKKKCQIVPLLREQNNIMQPHHQKEQTKKKEKSCYITITKESGPSLAANLVDGLK